MSHPQMEAARRRLERLLAAHDLTAGTYVRIRGDHLVVGRPTDDAHSSGPATDDRVRLTRLRTTSFGLSVKRHTGRWERTPFSGTMAEMVDTMLGVMPHLIAPY